MSERAREWWEYRVFYKGGGSTGGGWMAREKAGSAMLADLEHPQAIRGELKRRKDLEGQR